jgi:hypothetical protein
MFVLVYEGLKRITKPIFQDKKLEIYKDYVVVKDYYAPGLDKKLRTSDIENVCVRGGRLEFNRTLRHHKKLFLLEISHAHAQKMFLVVTCVF